MIRAIAVFVLLFSTVSVRAETVLTPAKGCTRAILQKAVDNYIDALKQGKPSLMPLTPQAKYIERRKTLKFGEGIWQKPLVIDLHRSILDVDICETFTEIISAKNNPQYVTGTLCVAKTPAVQKMKIWELTFRLRGRLLKMKKSADLRTPTYLASGARQLFPEGLLSLYRRRNYYAARFQS